MKIALAIIATLTLLTSYGQQSKGKDLCRQFVEHLQNGEIVSAHTLCDIKGVNEATMDTLAQAFAGTEEQKEKTVGVRREEGATEHFWYYSNDKHLMVRFLVVEETKITRIKLLAAEKEVVVPRRFLLDFGIDTPPPVPPPPPGPKK